MRSKIVSATEAVALVQNGDTLCCSGFGSNGVPVALILALEARFLQTRSPAGLTLLFGGGPGDGAEAGVNHLAHEGLLARVIGGHYGLVPKIGRMALQGQVEAWNLPLGVISHLYRDIACGLPGTVSRVGLGTFVDPRLEGCKIGPKTKDELVEVVQRRRPAEAVIVADADEPGRRGADNLASVLLAYCPVVRVVVLSMVVIVIVLNLIIDVLYTVLDPRVR